MAKPTSLIATLLAAACLFSNPLIAEAKPLNGMQINTLIRGKNVALKTKFGTFPLRYRADGIVLGDGSKLGLAKFFAPKENGKWWIRDTQLCQKVADLVQGQNLVFYD